MRPERLELEGFTAFREPTEVDFAGADLFALTGNTGAGKSSVIDAICFALYGTVPRYDDRRLVAPVISEGRNEAKVRLDFSVAGERYTAVRVVRRQGKGASTKDARLERADGEVLAGTADELTAEVERLLGLDFEHFTTCVVLPQGDFAKFLHAKPRDRQQLLVNLLDLLLYDRMRELAKGRENEAKGAVELIESRLGDQQALASPERLKEVEAQLGRLDELLTAIDAAHDELEQLAAERAAAEAARDRLRDEVARLEGIAAPEGLEALAEQVEAAQQAIERAAAEEDEASGAVDAAEAALGALMSRSELDAALARHDQADELRSRVAKGEEVVAGLVSGAEVAARELDAAKRAADAAAADLEHARLADRARELVLALEVGEPCPVCHQAVHELPAHEVSDFDAVLAAHTEAEQRLRQAEEQARTSSAELDKATALLADRRAQLDEIEQQLAGVPDRDELAKRATELTKAEQALAGAKSRARSARDAARRARKNVEELQTQQAEARRAFHAVRDAVSTLEPPPVTDDVVADWHALASWAADQRPQRAGAVADARAAAQSDRDKIAEAIRRVDELGQELAVQRERQEVAHELARHLSANGFEKWVLDAALRRLATTATAILYELSGGAYSLGLDDRGNFCVIDHANADAERSTRTLSGGETFLTSLALALALADQVAQLAAGGSARLESIFLDEGFGTLDAGTLDTVTTAIENLGAEGRMVGLISHVPDLAEQLTTRFEVVKQAHTSTITRIDG